jgi:hypothetical protein
MLSKTDGFRCQGKKMLDTDTYPIISVLAAPPGIFPKPVMEKA